MTVSTLPRTALAAFFSEKTRDAACGLLRAAGVVNVVPADAEAPGDARADVIVTDWPPLGLDLAAMLAELRAHFGKCARTPVVLISTRDGRADLDEARRAGVNAYVVAPVSSALLKHRLARLDYPGDAAFA